jgi:hypothetical protein
MMGSAGVLVDGLLRLVRPFIVTCMSCLVVSFVLVTRIAAHFLGMIFTLASYFLPIF